MTAPGLRAVLAAAALIATLPAVAEPELSGSIESSLAGVAGAGEAAAFSCGFEEYANLRLKTKVGERGTVFAATNMVAASGSYLPPETGLAATSFVAGEGYAAALELERLYFRVEGEAADLEAGLMRLAFGYGQAFSPSDFLCPKNPLLPDARPRGVLGVAATAYPSETTRIKAFGVSGNDPFAADGGGTIFGAAADLHGEKASLQALYAFETPSSTADWGIHRAGLLLKLEAEAGIAFDALYAYDGASPAGIEGLAASVGADYSLLDGDLYVLCQYLYNGSGAIVELNRRNYLYVACIYNFNDYTSSTLSCIASLDDLSLSPALVLEHEPFQGLGLSLSCRVPLDAHVFSESGEYGELGPESSGYRAMVTMKAKLKF